MSERAAVRTLVFLAMNVGIAAPLVAHAQLLSEIEISCEASDSLQTALAAVAPGGRVIIRSAACPGNLMLSRDLRIQGGGSDLCVAHCHRRDAASSHGSTWCDGNDQRGHHLWCSTACVSSATQHGSAMVGPSPSGRAWLRSLTSSLFESVADAGNGGGIAVMSDGELRLINTTVASNVASFQLASIPAAGVEVCSWTRRPTLDQRLRPRPANGGCDVGAFERQADTPS
jgi:hypothetical protein